MSLRNSSTRFTSRERRPTGFSLLELMVAMLLGLLLSAGIITLFSSTSQTSRLQDGLAHLQENGRYAVTRINGEFRQLGGQYCSNKGAGAPGTTNLQVWQGRAPMVFSATLGTSGLPDNGGNSVDASGNLVPAVATTAYILSPRFFVQGYACSTGTCSPALPSSLPASGLAAGRRVPNTDVLTVRYQRGTGWPVAHSPAANCASGGSITLDPQAGDMPVNFAATTSPPVPLSTLAMVTDCQNASVLPIAAAAGNVLTVGTVLPGSTPMCANLGDRDMRVFNFSKDFVTVSYFLAFSEDTNPDGKPNSSASKRLIPSLYRKENGAAMEEIVQGIDRLDFRYAVQDASGATRYLTADLVNTRNGGAIACPPKPDGVLPAGAATPEPGCLWRAVSGIETHMLFNTVNDIFGLDSASRSYRYSLDAPPYTTAPTTMPSGLGAGSMLRREFVSLVSVRNYNP